MRKVQFFWINVRKANGCEIVVVSETQYLSSQERDKGEGEGYEVASHLDSNAVAIDFVLLTF